MGGLLCVVICFSLYLRLPVLSTSKLPPGHVTPTLGHPYQGSHPSPLSHFLPQTPGAFYPAVPEEKLDSPTLPSKGAIIHLSAAPAALTQFLILTGDFLPLISIGTFFFPGVAHLERSRAGNSRSSGI